MALPAPRKTRSPGKTRPPGCLRQLFGISPEEKGLINGTSCLVLWVPYQSQNIEALELTLSKPLTLQMKTLSFERVRVTQRVRDGAQMRTPAPLLRWSGTVGLENSASGDSGG